VDIVHTTHATIVGGHYGVTRTVKKLKDKFFWPKMHEDVVHHLTNCESCLRNMVSTKKSQGEYQPLEIPQRRCDSVSMDQVVFGLILYSLGVGDYSLFTLNPAEKKAPTKF
jgi:Integrase zinc binding domain